MTGPGGAGPAAGRAERTLFTSRTAVLAVVVCAIALSLAYPVREYIAQRRQIDQLLAQQHNIQAQLRHLQDEQRRLADPAYVEQLARDRLHLCMRGDTCYVVIGNGTGHGAPVATAKLQPWYERLWQSVHAADHGSAQ